MKNKSLLFLFAVLLFPIISRGQNTEIWKGDFPELEVNSPATMNKFMGGDYSVDVRWFDT
jgi:hypothetical protein